MDMTGGTTIAVEDVETPSLSPAEQKILPYLLAGDAESQIALALEKSQATVNKQVGAIFRAYCVNSKHQLIARHYEIQARKNLPQNGANGVNTPLQGAREEPNNPPVARKTTRRKHRHNPLSPWDRGKSLPPLPLGEGRGEGFSLLAATKTV